MHSFETCNPYAAALAQVVNTKQLNVCRYTMIESTLLSVSVGTVHNRVDSLT